jgi:hypothetical protein
LLPEWLLWFELVLAVARLTIDDVDGFPPDKTGTAFYVEKVDDSKNAWFLLDVCPLLPWLLEDKLIFVAAGVPDPTDIPKAVFPELDP